MTQRRFGPIRGAGVAIIEKDGDKPIEAAALGWAGYAGLLEKGPVGQLIVCPTRSSFFKKCGSYIAESQLPDACFDYFDANGGAGGIALVRVTDGDEAAASINLYARRTTRAKIGSLTAKNGGRWGGKKQRKTANVATSGDITNTTLTTVVTVKKDEFKGGWIELDAVTSKRYEIVSNTTAGVITVVSDATMKDDWTAAGLPSNLRYYIYLETGTKLLSVEVKDGEEYPTTEFGLNIYVDSVLTYKYPNLSIDPASARYWISVINNDTNNDEVTAADTWVGSYLADVRPANWYGLVASCTPTTLTATIHEFTVTTGDCNPTVALGTTTDAHDAQTITVTFSGPTTGVAVSDIYGALGTLTTGSLFTPNNKWTPPFTITAGGTAMENGDVVKLVYKPFLANSLIGGAVYPDKVNYSRTYYQITANTHKMITVADGSDITGICATSDSFMVAAKLEMVGGKDGHASITDAKYIGQAWNQSNSPFNQLFGKNLGVVKMATPGVTATAVQKAGIAYCEAKNMQYRVEIPSTTLTEVDADTYCNDTIGRNDFAVVSFPSYGYVADPQAQTSGKLKLTTLTGQIHGREARIAADSLGYHQAQAGITAILSKVLKLPTGDILLNEEYLNPIGINVVKKSKGNFILWGDRTLWLDSNFKWKHQREQLSYYEHVLQENFDWIVFQLNDSITQKTVITSLKDYFIPEWQKRALRGDTFESACIIKMDDENNTNATRAAGDMNAEVRLRLADTVERFNITIGKQGIFESVNQ